MNRRGIIGIVAGGVVLVAAAGAVWWFAMRTPSAEDVAREYLAALADADLDTIQRMREPLDDDAERILEDAFTGASGYVSDPSVEDVRADGDRMIVRASARLGGEEREVSFTLERGADGGFVVASDGLATLTVEASLEGGGRSLPSARIGDATVPTGTSIAVLPAEYRVDAAPAGILTGSTDIAVSTDRAAHAELIAALSPDATALAQEQLDAYAASCAEPAAAVPERCGLVVPWAADLVQLERISFRIDKLPVVTISADASAFEATGGAIVATAVGTTHDGTPGSFTYRTDDWALRGSVGFADAEMVLTVH